ncbi:MAG TPA: cytoplasmic protein [Devosia sp.]|nr:cytoplasmic protein [Devosia sp.]
MKMTLSAQDGLVYIMVVTAAADHALSNLELNRMSALVKRLPIFEGYDVNRLPEVSAKCADLLASVGIEGVLELVIAKLPERLHDTAYALAVEIAAVDLELEQEELRWLEMVRDALVLDRLTTAAIEVAARARLRKA